MNLYLELFLTFSKIGVCTFGGGYAMLPILQREVVEKQAWATQEELSDYFAIGQCTPGVIAVNTATFVGQKMKGNLGALSATLGVVFPSVVIITLLAAFLQNFIHIPAVGHAFAGVRACVVALIAHSVLKLAKGTVRDGATRGIFCAVAALSLLGGYVAGLPWLVQKLTAPAQLVLLAGLCGFLLRRGGRET